MLRGFTGASHVDFEDGVEQAKFPEFGGDVLGQPVRGRDTSLVQCCAPDFLLGFGATKGIGQLCEQGGWVLCECEYSLGVLVVRKQGLQRQIPPSQQCCNCSLALLKCIECRWISIESGCEHIDVVGQPAHEFADLNGAFGPTREWSRERRLLELFAYTGDQT